MEGLWERLFYKNIESALNNPQCPGFEDNERRIKFILGKIDPKINAKLISNFPVVKKSAKKSCEFRTKGNLFFNSTEESKLHKAVEEYTKSVAHAPTGSQELALAYANRSAVLFKARLISDCLLDIERALQNNYPDNLKAKLYLRKAICLQILKSRNDPSIKEAFAETREWAKKMDDKNKKIMEEMLAKQEKVTSINKSTFSKWDGKKFLPKLSAENPKIPGLSDAVEIQYSEKYGRHIVATRDIEPGEVIALQKAYSAVIQPNSRYSFCWNCCEQTWASIPCESCVVAVFCSEICREKAMLEHHDIECPIIPSLPLIWSSSLLTPLRIIVKGLKEMDNSLDVLRKSVEKFNAEKNPLLKGFTNNVLEPNKFSSVYCLSTDLKNGMGLSLSLYSNSIIAAFLLATKTQYFGSRKNDNLKILSSQKNFIFVVGLFEKLIKLSGMNAFGKWEGEGFQFIAPALGFFNHSCNPMIVHSDHNDYMANRVLFPVKKGEQIFYTYGATYREMPTHQRQTFLSMYNFLCDCEACKNNWSEERDIKIMNGGIKNMSLLFMGTNSLINLVLKKCYAMKDHENVYRDFEKDVACVVTALQKFHRLQRQPSSFEILSTQKALRDVLGCTTDRLLSLD